MADDNFHIIPDASVIVRVKGVYYQKKVYRRGDRIFAGWASGFIRLGGGGATSNPNASYENLDLPFQTGRGKTGEPLMPTIEAVGQVKAA